MKGKSIIGVKGFGKNMTCRGFKFEEGKIYEEKTAKICEKGFHFCINPIDVLTYYNVCDSEFAIVEALGEIDKKETEDSKIVTTKIKIHKKLDLPAFIEASVKYLVTLCKTNGKNIVSGNSSNQVASGNSSKQGASGYSSKQVASGYFSKQGASGNFSNQGASGDSSKQVASGYSSNQGASGNFSNQVASGDSSNQGASGYFSNQVASGNSSNQGASGDSSKQGASGNSSKQVASGDSSRQELKGKHSVAMAAGKYAKIKGKKECWITLAEWEYRNDLNEWIPVCVKSAQIDGIELKEDVFYTLKNKKFVAVD